MTLPTVTWLQQLMFGLMLYSIDFTLMQNYMSVTQHSIRGQRLITAEKSKHA